MARPGVIAVAAGTLLGLAASGALAQGGAGGGQAAPRSTPARTVQAEELIPPELAAYEDRPVRRVVIELLPVAAGGAAVDATAALGLDPGTEQLARNQLRTSPGRPYARRLATEDLGRLNRLGRFKRVESRVQLIEDGSVDVYFLVEPQPVIGDVQTIGNMRLSDGDILGAIPGLIGTPVDETRLDRICRVIEDKYREKGYYSAKVTVDREALERNSIVVFRVREGDRSKVTEIRFEGNNTFAARELRREVKTKEWFGFFEKGALDDDVLAQDVAQIAAFYRDRGYLDAKVDRVITPSLDGREAVVTFVVAEGPVYTLRSLKIEQNDDDERVFTAEQLQGLMSIKPGDVYSAGKLTRSTEGLKAAYGKIGYVDATVERRELRDPIEPQVDVKLFISEGRRFRTGEVIVRGNDLTRNDVVRRHVMNQPDRPLDATAAEDTKRRLRETRLFTPDVRVTIQPEDPTRAPGPDGLAYRDVLVEVQETNTGNFSLGGAVGSDAGVTARIAVTQNNFDITDTPDSIGGLFSSAAFRGGGQRFVAEALPGDRQQVIAVSLAEPALNGSDYGGSVGVSFNRRDWTDYTEQRYGARFGIERRFGERWFGSVPVRFENIELSGIDADAPTDYFKFEEGKILTGIGLNLSRRTTDNIYRPSRGVKTEFGVEQVGLLGGDFEFTKLHTEHQIYFPLGENFYGRRTVISARARADYIPQGFDEVPVYERFYLGGQSFRGFDYRGVGPRGIRNDNGQPSDEGVGGNFLFFAGIELQQPLYEDVVAGVVFLDTGTVNQDLSLDNYRASVGVGLRIYIDQLTPFPLSFDFGFPIKDAEGDERRLFTFSIDVPFN